MKKGKLIVALALAVLIGVGGGMYTLAEASADTNDTQQSTSTAPRIGLRRITGLRGIDYVISVIKDKFNITDDAIDSARQEGKNMYTLLEENDISHDDFVEELVKAKEKAIDEAVSKGTITKEQGETNKEYIKDNAGKYEGKGNLNAPRHSGNRLGINRNGKGKGASQSNRERGFNGNCPFVQN